MLIVVLFSWLAADWILADEQAAPKPAETSKPTALNETLERRLVQLDVGVEGDPEAISKLTAEDFALYVGEREIHGLILDRLCDQGSSSQEPATPPEGQAQGQPPSIPTSATRPTFILFFDQPHLTVTGRERALETARELIMRAIVNGARAAIVSNAKRVETVVPLTGTQELLLAGLERLRTDPRQWDSYSDTETSRAQQVRNAYEMNPTRCPPWLAETYAREEYLLARQSTQRLANALGVLAEVPAPKGLVYFGDSLRQKAGLHYLRLICPDSVVTQSAAMVPSAATEFDSVVNEALARGVHFYTIQAEGITADFPGWDRDRHRDAQDALVGLAAETGGEAFLGGASNDNIVRRIEARGCPLLLSFPPDGLSMDTPLVVSLSVRVPKVRIRVQGRIVVPSAQSMKYAKILAAFVDPGSSDDGSLRALLIPRGSDGKAWRVSVQLRLRPSGLPDNSAELGASVVRGDKVTEHFASSIATKNGTRPLVVEKTLEFPPGEFSIVAVAHDVQRSDIASSRLNASWPDPHKGSASIAPVAVLQAGAAAMSKDGTLASNGSLARDTDELLDPTVSISLASVVCRGAKATAPIVVERWLEGGPENEFVPVTIAPGDAPCVQTVDVIGPGRLKPGIVDYRVLARVGSDIVAQERRALRVAHGPESKE